MTQDEPSRGSETRGIQQALGQLRVPERIGPYVILDVLGEGGMGTVYLAEEADPARRVALKVIKPGMDSREVLRRFRYEQRTLARMNHDAIAKMFGVGVTEQHYPYFVMEWVDGEPLDVYCDLWQLDLKARLQLLQQICAGVQHAHDRGAVHRDLKPGNVLVARQGDANRPKVIDFGLARAMEPDEETPATAHDQVIGTLEYMAPEQVNRRHPAGVGVHTDIYALGVMLYQLVAGLVPFPKLRDLGFVERCRVIECEQPAPVGAVVAAHLTDRARVLNLSGRALRRAVCRELKWIVATAMHKDPPQRYPTAIALANDLQRFLDKQAVLAGPSGVGYRLTKFLRRRPIESIAGILVGVSIVGGIVGVVAGEREARASNARALVLAARLAQERGNWTQALTSLDAAAATERVDSVEITIGRLLAHIGRFDDQAATAELRRLEAMVVPEAQQGRVLLLRGLFANRTLNPEAGLDFVRAALQRQGLSANERDLAEYLLADDFDTARAAIEHAVLQDPHDRLANLAKVSMLFCIGHVDDSLAFGRQLAALYPDDPIVDVSLLLQAVLSNRPDEAEAASHRLTVDDEGMVDAVRQFAKSAGTVATIDDLVVRFVFDREEFGIPQQLQLTATCLALPRFLMQFYGATAGDAPERMLKTLGSMVPPCYSRGLRHIPKLVPLALSISKDEPTDEQDAMIRDVMRKSADGTGVALFRFFSGYLYAMEGMHGQAVVEYERAARAGQLIPMAGSINRGLLASNYRLWQDAAVDEKPQYRNRALTALAQLLPQARRASAFEYFLQVACDLEDGAVVAVIERCRERSEHDDAAEARLREVIRHNIERLDGKPIVRYLQAALGD